LTREESPATDTMKEEKHRKKRARTARIVFISELDSYTCTRPTAGSKARRVLRENVSCASARCGRRAWERMR
jgi:hypothetical protein